MLAQWSPHSWYGRRYAARRQNTNGCRLCHHSVASHAPTSVASFLPQAASAGYAKGNSGIAGDAPSAMLPPRPGIHHPPVAMLRRRISQRSAGRMVEITEGRGQFCRLHEGGMVEGKTDTLSEDEHTAGIRV